MSTTTRSPRADATQANQANPEPATAIRAELGAYGLWLEVERAPGDWQAVFLPTRTVRRLVAALLADRQQTLAALDPPTWRRPRKGAGLG
jgi:hypothetical protein